MEYLMNDGMPPIGGRSPCIFVDCKVESLVPLNLTVHTKMSNNMKKKNQIVTMMGKYVNKNCTQIFKQAMPFIIHQGLPYHDPEQCTDGPILNVRGL